MLCDYTDVTTPAESIGTFVSLYAGAGGLDIGFALAGFTPVWTNEIDRWAVDTHRRAFKRLADSLPHLEAVPDPVAGDLEAALQGSPPPTDATLVVGGPPCQGFSVAGKMDPDDPRSMHVLHFLDVVELVRPQGFVMENVKALFANKRWGDLRRTLVERAEAAGYGTHMFVLKASHFGVPQARERMFFVGIRDTVPAVPVPTPADAEPTLRAALLQLPSWGEPGNDSLCTAKVTPAHTPVLRPSPFAGMLFNGQGRPMNLDVPAPTLPATMGGNRTPIVDQQQLADGEPCWILEYHDRLWRRGLPPLDSVPDRLRRLTVEEAAAIQTFPLGMEWAGPQSAQYRQIGNAVPPRLAWHVARSVAESLGLRR